MGDDYMPTLPTPDDLSEMDEYVLPLEDRMRFGEAKEYTLTISEPVSNANQATVTIKVRGADPKWWKENGEIRLVGTWRSNDASTISHTGSGLFYFEGDGNARLVGNKMTDVVGTERTERVDDVLWLTAIRFMQRFVPGEANYGEHYATPCRGGSCIGAGRIRWKCEGIRWTGRRTPHYP
jgi:hypothetical protein